MEIGVDRSKFRYILLFISILLCVIIGCILAYLTEFSLAAGTSTLVNICSDIAIAPHTVVIYTLKQRYLT